MHIMVKLLQMSSTSVLKTSQLNHILSQVDDLLRAAKKQDKDINSKRDHVT